LFRRGRYAEALGQERRFHWFPREPVGLAGRIAGRRPKEDRADIDGHHEYEYQGDCPWGHGLRPPGLQPQEKGFRSRWKSPTRSARPGSDGAEVSSPPTSPWERL